MLNVKLWNLQEKDNHQEYLFVRTRVLWLDIKSIIHKKKNDKNRLDQN